MKYIRTPIGIYDLENSVFYDFDGLCKYHISHCEYYENNPDECITSDLLEELCDEFIDIIPRENGKAYHDHWEWSAGEKRFNNDIGESVPFDYFSDNTDFRGAIWTDKGLIYVVKMNDKGELELC